MWEKVARSETLKLIFLLAVAFGVRVWGLQDQSFTSDELVEIGIARSSLQEIVQERDGFPPLYHLILHAWLKLFDEDVAARWLSVAFGCLAVLAMWRLLFQATEAKARFWSTLLLAIAPMHVWYSQETRAYVLYFLIALAALGLFLRALRSNRKQDWIAYAIACSLGLLTHYFFAILIFANGVLLLVEKRTWLELKQPVFAHCSLAFFSLPAVLLLQADFAYQTACIITRQLFNVPAIGYTFVSFLAGYSIGPSLRELHMTSFGQALTGFLPWLLLVGFCMAILLQKALSHPEALHFKRQLLLLTLLPVLLCGLIAEAVKVSYKPQYVLWASIPIFFWMGKVIAQGSAKKLMAVALLTLCLLSGLSLYNRRESERYQNEDVKSLAQFLSTQAKHVPVLVMSDYMNQPVRHYLGAGWSIRPVPNAKNGEGLEKALAVMETHLADSEELWLVYTRPFHGDPNGSFLRAVQAEATVHWEATFPGIELFKIKRGIDWSI